MTQSQESDDRINKRIAETNIAIDDYIDTIHAIIGFVNLYALDDITYQPRPDIKRFQGRRLAPVSKVGVLGGANDKGWVSPDLGIVIDEKLGILGEVRKNFPKDAERAKKEFVQLKRYDQELQGWPVKNGQLENHDIVLLVHLTTSPYAKEFYEEHLTESGIKFERLPAIIEFGRISQVREFFLLRTVLGEPKELGTEKKLKYGVKVPMAVFLTEYAKTKLYDAEPPLPYLTKLMWVHVITPIAVENPRFEHLGKRQKLGVTIAVDDIVKRLDEGFSFRSWHSDDLEHQPCVPRSDWVKKACKFLVESGEAEWVTGREDSEITVFYQKHGDVDSHFVSSYVELEERKKVLSLPLPGFEPQK